MATRKRGVTTERPVMSMRLELGRRAYRSFPARVSSRIRDVLWQFVEQRMGAGGAQSAALERRRFWDGALDQRQLNPILCPGQSFQRAWRRWLNKHHGVPSLGNGGKRNNQGG